MDPTEHIPDVKLFHYVIHAMPLDADELDHLARCSHCQALLAEFQEGIAA